MFFLIATAAAVTISKLIIRTPKMFKELLNKQKENQLIFTRTLCSGRLVIVVGLRRAWTPQTSRVITLNSNVYM